jgi:DNA-binding NarL/FixJ family response regulator
VVEASSGKQALAAIREALFELVILDLEMPDVDGFEFLKVARADLPDLKILVVSGYLTGPMLEAAKLCGAAATLEKQSAPHSLLITVCEVLRS